jgi:tetratricopeptide (TPR) repeat protein
VKRWVALALAAPRVLAVLASLFAASFATGGCVASAALPPKAIALNAAGARAIEQGDLAAAEASLSVALEYSPRFVEAWINLGYVELARGNFEQARRDLTRARELNRQVPAPLHALGVLADRQGDGRRAESWYRAALLVDPGFAPARANLARLLFARGQYENAREQFERLAQVSPATLEGWTGQIEALEQLGRHTRAAEVAESARERFGDAPSLMILVARQLLDRGAWQDAEAALAPIVGGTDRPRAGAAWAWIGVARAGEGDLAGAAQAAREALAIDRDDPVASLVLSRTGKR